MGSKENPLYFVFYHLVECILGGSTQYERILFALFFFITLSSVSQVVAPSMLQTVVDRAIQVNVLHLVEKVLH